jgi:glycosyltransferase involved in cell wall biosynthesis
MRRIAIVSPTILPGDAVGHDILHMWRILEAQGHAVELFSANWGKPDPRSQDDLSVDDFLDGDPSALILLHHAIGWAPAVRVIAEARCRRVVRYHNVTPAHFYDSLSQTYADFCRLGRRQLHELAQAQCDLYLADSPFNRGDLCEAGADPQRCVVVPPFNDIEHLAQVPADPEVLRDYGDGRTNLLFVGRRAPNKGHRFLIDAFAAYQRGYDPDSRLLLVGKGDAAMSDYTAALREQVRRLGLQTQVIFLDGATESELRGYYATASVFVLASEHEGFCVPAVEAMALRVPIVAYGTTAVPQTVGEAGLVWDQPDPFLLAQSIACAVRDPLVRQRLVERGWRRYQDHFCHRRIEHAFLDALRPVLSASVPSRKRAGMGSPA